MKKKSIQDKNEKKDFLRKEITVTVKENKKIVKKEKEDSEKKKETEFDETLEGKLSADKTEGTKIDTMNDIHKTNKEEGKMTL